MTTTTHTPGPWTVRGPIPGPERWKIIDDSGNVPSIATCLDAHGRGAANARLIAAAPDLLKALQALWDEPHEILHQLLNEDDWDLVDAAIKKATGGEA